MKDYFQRNNKTDSYIFKRNKDNQKTMKQYL